MEITEKPKGQQTIEDTPESNQGKLSYEQQKELRKKQKQAEKNIAETEIHISELEAAIHLLEDQMSTPEGASNPDLPIKHSNFSSQLEKAMENWEYWSNQLEEINNLQP